MLVGPDVSAAVRLRGFLAALFEKEKKKTSIARKLLALLPAWPYSAGWGYYPSGGLGLLLLLVLVLLFIRPRAI